jgi:hypothetical protein
MKQWTTILAALVLALSANAQYHTLVDEDHTWYTQQGSFVIFHATQYFEGDTIISDTTYHKFYTVLDLAPDQPALDALIREDVDEQKVYIRDGEGDRLLYDFDVTEEDIVTVHVLGCPVELEIGLIETIEINGTTRKKINIANSSEYWIEGIGSIFSVLGPGYINCVADWDPLLLCFWEISVQAFSNPDADVSDCSGVITDVDDANQALVLTLYPNPVQEHLNLEWSTQLSRSHIFYITSADGKIVKEGSIDAGSNSVDVSDLSNGWYSFTVIRASESISASFYKE